MKDVSELWLFWALGSAAFAALTAVFAKLGVAGIDSDLATFIRVIVILTVLGLMLGVSGRFSAEGLTPRTLGFLVASGLATGASWLCYFRAMKLGDAARIAPVDKLSVVMVAIIATAFLGEKLSPINWLGVVLITGGVVLTAL